MAPDRVTEEDPEKTDSCGAPTFRVAVDFGRGGNRSNPHAATNTAPTTAPSKKNRTSFMSWLHQPTTVSVHLFAQAHVANYRCSGEQVYGGSRTFSPLDHFLATVGTDATMSAVMAFMEEFPR